MSHKNAFSFTIDKNSDSQKYNKADGILAIAFFIFNEFNSYFWFLSPIGSPLGKAIGMSAYDFLLKIMAAQEAAIWANLIASIPMEFIPVAAIFIILAVRKQKLSSLGFRKHHNIETSLIGIAAGVGIALFMYCVLFFCGKPDVFHSLSKLRLSVFALVSNIVFTGLTEELGFRAFIQSRITGMIRNKWGAILTVGLMFWVSHSISDYLSGPIKATDILVQGVFMVGIHIVFLFLYKKTDNILAPVFCHGIYDFMISPIYF